MVVDGFDSAAFDQCVLELFLTASNLVWRVTEFQGKNIEEHRLEKILVLLQKWNVHKSGCLHWSTSDIQLAYFDFFQWAILSPSLNRRLVRGLAIA